MSTEQPPIISEEEIKRIAANARIAYPFRDEEMSDWTWQLKINAYERGARDEVIINRNIISAMNVVDYKKDMEKAQANIATLTDILIAKTAEAKDYRNALKAIRQNTSYSSQAMVITSQVLEKYPIPPITDHE